MVAVRVADAFRDDSNDKPNQASNKHTSDDLDQLLSAECEPGVRADLLS